MNKNKKSCRDVILEHINSTNDWIKKSSLYPIAEDWLAETVGRACRDLEEEGLIEKSFYDGKYAKGLVQYARKGERIPKPYIPKFEIRDGIAVQIN